MKVRELLEAKSLPNSPGSYVVSREQLLQLRSKYKEIICEGEDGEMLAFLVDVPYNISREQFIIGCNLVGVKEEYAKNIWAATNRYIDNRDDFYYRYQGAQDHTTFVRLVTFEQWGEMMLGGEDDFL